MESIDFKKFSSKLPVYDYPTNAISLPVIVMSNPGQKELDQLRSACEEWGIFYIINHGVPEEILEEFKLEAIKLFSHPTNVKVHILKSRILVTIGYVKFGDINNSPNSLWHESFSLGTHEQLLQHASKLWPPHGNPRFCHVIESYETEMKRLAKRQLKLILASIGLTPEDMNWVETKKKEEPFGQHMLCYQILHSYPPNPAQVNAIGFRAHTDTCLIAVLNQVNNLSGLQVLHKDKWVMVDPIPGALVVNCGDLIHILTNGRFVSAMHRVIPPEDKRRYSAVLFYGPPYDAPIAPASKLVKSGHQPLFQTKPYREHLRCKYGGDVILPAYVPIDMMDKNKNADGE